MIYLSTVSTSNMHLYNSTASISETRPLTIHLLSISVTLGIFAFFQLYSIQAVLPLLIRDMHATVRQAGDTVGAGVLAVALVSPFIGMLSDARGRTPLIVGAMFFITITTAAMSLTSSIQTLTVFRFLQGLGVPGITVVTIAYIGEEFAGSDMTRMVSAYVSGSVLGGFLGRFLFGHLSTWMPWKSAFLVMAALNLIGALVVSRFLPSSRNFVANPRIVVGLKTLCRHLCNPSMLTACALGMCVLFSLVGCFTYVNLHLAAAPFQFSSGELANVFAVYLLGVFVTPMSNKIILLLGIRSTILMALVVSSCGLLLTLIPLAWTIVMALALMSCGVFIAQSCTISFIARSIQHGRSVASGLYYMTYYGGGVLGAWICGIAFTHGAWLYTVILLVSVQAFGFAIGWFFISDQ